jgi:hypothetical protein
MVARRRQLMPFWLSLPTAGEQLLKFIQRENKKLIIFSFILLILIKPFDSSLIQPLAKRLPGVGYVPPAKPWHWRGNGSIMVGMFVCLCLASQNPFGGSFLFLQE